MSEHDRLATQFEIHRNRLRAVAYRMLGSQSEAEDAVQETWIRLSRSGADEVENVGGWLTTVVSRVSLDMLRSRRSRREEWFDPASTELLVADAEGVDPEHEALMADAIGPALLVVLDTLAPAERLAFVLHDLFGVPYDEIAPIVGRNPAAARQLASRARRRVRGASMLTCDGDQIRQYAIVDAFLAAAREGDFDALVALLDPDVILRADHIAAGMGTAPELRGAKDVAGRFVGGAQVARTALVDGQAGAVWMSGKQARIVFSFSFSGNRITAIEIIADPTRIQAIDVTIPDSARG